MVSILTWLVIACQLARFGFRETVYTLHSMHAQLLCNKTMLIMGKGYGYTKNSIMHIAARCDLERRLNHPEGSLVRCAHCS